MDGVFQFCFCGCNYRYVGGYAGLHLHVCNYSSSMSVWFLTDAIYLRRPERTNHDTNLLEIHRIEKKEKKLT